MVAAPLAALGDKEAFSKRLHVSRASLNNLKLALHSIRAQRGGVVTAAAAAAAATTARRPRRPVVTTKRSMCHVIIIIIIAEIVVVVVAFAVADAVVVGGRHSVLCDGASNKRTAARRGPYARAARMLVVTSGFPWQLLFARLTAFGQWQT